MPAIGRKRNGRLAAACAFCAAATKGSGWRAWTGRCRSGCARSGEPSGEPQGEAAQDRPDRREEDGARAAGARPGRRCRAEPGAGAERGRGGPQAPASRAPASGQGADLADQRDRGTPEAARHLRPASSRQGRSRRFRGSGADVETAYGAVPAARPAGGPAPCRAAGSGRTADRAPRGRARRRCPPGRSPPGIAGIAGSAVSPVAPVAVAPEGGDAAAAARIAVDPAEGDRPERRDPVIRSSTGQPPRLASSRDCADPVGQRGHAARQGIGRDGPAWIRAQADGVALVALPARERAQPMVRGAHRRARTRAPS